MVQERFQCVVSQLFQHRIFRCGGAVDDDMANIIVAQLLYLDAVDPQKDIVMYVNSPGGSVTAGMAIFDTMRHIRLDISTVCVGLAARYCVRRWLYRSRWLDYGFSGYMLFLERPDQSGSAYSKAITAAQLIKDDDDAHSTDSME